MVDPRSEVALHHCGGVETETTTPPEAYSPYPTSLPGRPDDWQGLPWA